MNIGQRNFSIIILACLLASTCSTSLYSAAEPIESKVRRSIKNRMEIFDLEQEYLIALNNYLPQISSREQRKIINFLQRRITNSYQTSVETIENIEEAVEKFEETPEIVGMLDRLEYIEAKEPKDIAHEDLTHAMKTNYEIRRMVFDLDIRERVADEMLSTIIATYSQK